MQRKTSECRQIVLWQHHPGFFAFPYVADTIFDERHTIHRSEC